MYKQKCKAFTLTWYQLEDLKSKHPQPEKAFNQFGFYMDLTPQQRQRQFSLKSSPSSVAEIMGKSHSIGDSFNSVSTDSPTSIDYRTLKKVSSIKDQGSCGSCWAFAATGLYQSFMMFKGEKQYDLSQQYLLQCTSQYQKNILKWSYISTCNGGYLNSAGELARLNGLPLQTTFPYKADKYIGVKFPITQNICNAKQSYLYAQNPSLTTAKFYRNVTNAEMKVLLSNGPVAVSLFANVAFSAYKSGIFTSCPTQFFMSYSLLNHAVVVVGYTENGDYIIKNSWGTRWGEAGYITISKDKDCGLTAAVYQYTSTALAGNGLYYTKQIDLNQPNATPDVIPDVNPNVNGQKRIITILLFLLLIIFSLMV